VKLPATVAQQWGPLELLLIFLVIQKLCRARNKQPEVVQRTTRTGTIWEILGFECGAMAAYTGSCASSRARLNKLPGPLE
jgi:hypothetical protein